MTTEGGAWVVWPPILKIIRLEILGLYHVWLQMAVPTPLLDVTKLLKLHQHCVIREVEMECCTFLFIYLLVHTSIQQVRRENANDAGTARRRGAGGQGREPRRNALASDRLDEAMLVFEAELPVLESFALLVELAALLLRPLPSPALSVGGQVSGDARQRGGRHWANLKIFLGPNF